MLSLNKLLILAIFTLVFTACQTSTGVLSNAALSSPEAEVTASPTRKPTSTPDTQATRQAEGTATAVTKQTQRAQDAAATATQAKAKKATSTAKAEQKATAQAQEMADEIQKLFETGLVTNTAGTYHQLEDVTDSLAKINYVRPAYYTGFMPENFAIRADIAWNSASDTANWDRSGCGFIFGAQKEGGYDFIFLSLQGFARFSKPQPGSASIYSFSDRPYSGKLDKPSGDAKIMLVVFDKRATFYVNGEEVLSEYEGLMKPGYLLYAFVSGTNKGFGTRCTWREVDLWVFE